MKTKTISRKQIFPPKSIKTVLSKRTNIRATSLIKQSLITNPLLSSYHLGNYIAIQRLDQRRLSNFIFKNSHNRNKSKYILGILIKINVVNCIILDQNNIEY